MDIRTISSKNLIPVIDPAFIKQSPDEFLAENGGFLSEVAVVGKSSSGFVYFRSTTAPSNRETSEFFSTFASIADSIGIKVHAFVNGLADAFFAKNTSYSAIKDGGNPNPYFVDPFKDSYINYLKSVITELLNFPVQGLIIDDIKFPREEFSFCESCRRAFSEHYGIERMFSLGDIQRDNVLEQRWIKWRKDKIEEIIKDIATTSSLKPNVDFSFTIDIDPTIRAEKGALKHFGQDIFVISKYGIPTVHLSPWTSYPNTPSAPEFKAMKDSVQFIKQFQAQTQKPVNLYLWGVENESVLSLLDALKGEVTFRKVFIQNYFPKDFQKRREIHLGLTS